MEFPDHDPAEEETYQTLFFAPVILRIIALVVILALLVSNYLIWIQPLLMDWLRGEKDQEPGGPEEPIDPALDSQVRLLLDDP